MTTKGGASRRDVLAGIALAPALGAEQAMAQGTPAPRTDFRQAGTGAVTRDGADKLREILSVSDFGARGDGVTDDHAAITSAIAAAVALRKELVFPAGNYRHSQPLQFGFERLRVRGEGMAVLQYTGAGPYCVSVDAGERNVVYQHRLENLTIRGSGAPSQHGLFIRNVVHGARRNLYVRNVAGDAFHILGDVLSSYDGCMVSYVDNGAEDVVPQRAFFIGGTSAVSSTTACTFTNCVAENARAQGWHLDRATANIWSGGTSEGLPGIGLWMGPNAMSNVFTGFFMERNAGGDLDLAGKDNEFLNCTMHSRAASSPYERVRSVAVRSGAIGNRFRGGMSFYSILVQPGALSTRFEAIECHRIDDEGAGTVRDDVKQIYHSATRFPGRTFGNVEDPSPDALDWYQEIAFRPAFGGSRGDGRAGYAGQQGRATRIGNVVFFTLSLRVSSMASAPAGELLIRGLPFAANDEVGAAIAVGEWRGFAGPPGATQISATVVAGQPALRLSAMAEGGLAPLQGGVLRAGAQVLLSGQYLVG